MVKHGIKGMLALNGEKLTDRIMHEYQDLCVKYGRQVQLGQDMCLGMGFCIDETQQKAIERVRPYHDERYKWFATFGFVRYTDEQGRPWGTPGAPTRLPSIEDGVQQKAWLCGPPEHLIAQLRDIEAKYPGLAKTMERFTLEQLKAKASTFDIWKIPELGVIGETGHPRVQQAIERIVAAGRAAGVPIGLGGPPGELRSLVEAGSHVTLIFFDALDIGAAARAAVQAARASLV